MPISNVAALEVSRVLIKNIDKDVLLVTLQALLRTETARTNSSFQQSITRIYATATDQIEAIRMSPKYGRNG